MMGGQASSGTRTYFFPLSDPSRGVRVKNPLARGHVLGARAHEQIESHAAAATGFEGRGAA